MSACLYVCVRLCMLRVHMHKVIVSIVQCDTIWQAILCHARNWYDLS